MRRVNGWPLDCHWDPLNLSRSHSLAGLICHPQEGALSFSHVLQEVMASHLEHHVTTEPLLSACQMPLAEVYLTNVATSFKLFGLFVPLLLRCGAKVHVTHDPRHDSENSANSNLVCVSWFIALPPEQPIYWLRYTYYRFRLLQGLLKSRSGYFH